MYKDFAGGFVEGAERAKEIAMFIWDPIDPSPVAGNGCLAATLQPVIGCHVKFADAGQHHFVVASQGNQVAAISHFDQLVNDATDIGTTVDVVPQDDQRIVSARLDFFKQCSQRFAASMNITDCNRSSHAGDSTDIRSAVVQKSVERLSQSLAMFANGWGQPFYNSLIN